MPRFAANIDWLFTERPFLDRIPAAAAAGFGAVEILNPYAHDPQALRDALDAAELGLALINTPAGDQAAGERGTAALANRFAADLDRALRTAEVLRPEAIHIMAGIAGGQAARETYCANLAMATAAAPDRRFTIEPINGRDIAGYHLSRTDDAARVIAAVGASNLGLQLDLYHLQISEGDLTRRIAALAPLIVHVQIAGVPDRGEPDRGETSLMHLMATLDAADYRGWVGAEYRPAAGTEDGLGWLAPWRVSA